MNADLEKLQETNKTELERRGSIFNIGAPATEAVTIRDQQKMSERHCKIFSIWI